MILPRLTMKIVFPAASAKGTGRLSTSISMSLVSGPRGIGAAASDGVPVRGGALLSVLEVRLPVDVDLGAVLAGLACGALRGAVAQVEVGAAAVLVHGGLDAKPLELDAAVVVHLQGDVAADLRVLGLACAHRGGACRRGRELELQAAGHAEVVLTGGEEIGLAAVTAAGGEYAGSHGGKGNAKQQCEDAANDRHGWPSPGIRWPQY